MTYAEFITRVETLTQDAAPFIKVYGLEGDTSANLIIALIADLNPQISHAVRRIATQVIPSLPTNLYFLQDILDFWTDDFSLMNRVWDQWQDDSSGTNRSSTPIKNWDIVSRLDVATEKKALIFRGAFGGGPIRVEYLRLHTFTAALDITLPDFFVEPAIKLVAGSYLLRVATKFSQKVDRSINLESVTQNEPLDTIFKLANGLIKQGRESLGMNEKKFEQWDRARGTRTMMGYRSA